MTNEFDTLQKAPVLTTDGQLLVPPVCGMMLEKK